MYDLAKQKFATEIIGHRSFTPATSQSGDTQHVPSAHQSCILFWPGRNVRIADITLGAPHEAAIVNMISPHFAAWRPVEELSPEN